MKNTISLLVTLLILFAQIPADLHAQDDSGYVLRTPTAHEYLENIQANAESMPGSVLNVLFHRYPRLYQEDFDLLWNVYPAFVDLDYALYRGYWNETLVRSWLYHNQIDLSTVQEFQFENFFVTVTPRDFNADGVPEYVLDTSTPSRINRVDGCNATICDYLVIQPQGDEYILIHTPTLWHGSGPDWGSGDGAVMELRFEDLNADGLPEWVLAEGGYTVGGPLSGQYNMGQLMILAWRDGQLVDITPPGNYDLDQTTRYAVPAGGGGDRPTSIFVTWDFVNLDDDPALEVQQHQMYFDNWYCQIRETKTFDWNGELYAFADRVETFPEDTQNCAQRQAESALWDGNYSAAIELYEHSLTLEQVDYPYNENSPDWYLRNQIVQNQYLRARLALAYLLTGQQEQANTVLQSLAVEQITDEAINGFVNLLATTETDPLSLCQSVYSYFTEHFPREMYGHTSDETDTEQDEVYLPERAGCDAPGMIRDLISDHDFPTSISPVDELETLGLEVRKTLMDDLNGDGQNEWLIWLQTPMPPFFFVPQGDHYSVTQVEIDPYLIADNATTWPLPGDAGRAVIYLSSEVFTQDAPWTQAYHPFYTGGGMPDCVLLDSYYRLWMWRMDEDNHLAPLLNGINVCQDQIENLFSEDTTVINGGEAQYYDETTRQILYRWDASTLNYVEDENSTPAWTPDLVHIAFIDAYTALWNGDFETMISATENLPESVESEQLSDWLQARYLRGFALEQVGRTDEALAEYMAVHDAAPRSPLGQIAARHLFSTIG